MRYSLEEKEKIVDEYKNSGMSAVEFCNSKKIGTATLHRWLGSEKTTFVKVGEIDKSTDKNKDEIRIECGILKIFVTSNVDESLLRSVLASAVKVC